LVIRKFILSRLHLIAGWRARRRLNGEWDSSGSKSRKEVVPEAQSTSVGSALNDVLRLLLAVNVIEYITL